MNTPPADERNVRRLRNDVDDIYDLISGIQLTVGEHTATLDQHTATLDQHTATLDQHTATLDQHTVKLDHIIGMLETR